jgi:predicted Zn-dependent protease with MMP-like domain
VERERFEELVAKSLTELPMEFQDRLENIDMVVMDYPTPRQLAKVGRGMTLLGLYEGVPHTRRSRGYNLVTPDRIIIFQKPIEARCRSEKEIALEIQRVVRHEVAHHFGLDDESLREIESRKPRGWGDAGETLSY